MRYGFKTGDYRSTTQVDFHSGETKATYRVLFSRECDYESFDHERDYNKLFGWSYGILPSIRNWKIVPAHHCNSVRIGWRPTIDNKIELCFYVYKDGILYKQPITRPIERGTVYQIELECEDNHIKVTIGKEKRVAGRTYVQYKFVNHMSMEGLTPRTGYMLYPYFGGSNPAPHDMYIDLQRIS